VRFGAGAAGYAIAVPQLQRLFFSAALALGMLWTLLALAGHAAG
jgi:hypothetical protein